MRCLKIWALVGMVLAMSSMAFADTVTIDENNYTFILPFNDAVVGGLHLCDGAVGSDGVSCVSQISDIVAWRNDAYTKGSDITTQSVYMYSYGDADSPADITGTKFPAVKGVALYLAEPPLVNGAETLIYTPTADQPGYEIGGDGKPVTYQITSDTTAVPEPPTLMLLGIGLLGLALLG